MLLAANRRSTGIGVRPRGDRIEITADFTPDAALMIATATLIVGIVREVMTWPSFELARARRARVPSRPRLHAGAAQLAQGLGGARVVLPRESVRRRRQRADVDARAATAVAARDRGRTTRYFWPIDRRLGDPRSLRLIAAVMRGRAPSLLELDDRPAGVRQTSDGSAPGTTSSRSARCPARATSACSSRRSRARAAHATDWHADRHARLVARRLPARERQTRACVLARLPARTSRRLGSHLRSSHLAACLPRRAATPSGVSSATVARRSARWSAVRLEERLASLERRSSADEEGVELPGREARGARDATPTLQGGRDLTRRSKTGERKRASREELPDRPAAGRPRSPIRAESAEPLASARPARIRSSRSSRSSRSNRPSRSSRPTAHAALRGNDDEVNPNP